MHSRSIEFAKKFSVPIHVRSSFSDVPGTMIVSEPEAPDQAVCGVALVKDEARVTIEGVPDRPGASLAIFSKIAARKIAVDMIVQNVGAEGKADISFTVDRDELLATLEAVDEAAAGTGRLGLQSRRSTRQSFGRRARHGSPNGRRAENVPGVGRRGRQHPGHHDERDQNFRAAGPRSSATGAADRACGVRTGERTRRREWPEAGGSHGVRRRARSKSYAGCSGWKI